MQPILETRSLDKFFPRTGGRVDVLRDCHFELPRAGSVAITGPSGSGKSTLLNILGGLDEPSSGEVLREGVALDFSDQGALTNWRAEVVGFIFQFHFLLPDFTARENLLLPIRGRRKVSGSDFERADRFLALTDLTDRADHLPGELSGGEQQRIAVARAFMNRPQIVLADEPFGNLDHEIGARLGETLFELGRAEDTGLVIVTHDPQLAARADRHLALVDGALVDGRMAGES